MSQNARGGGGAFWSLSFLRALEEKWFTEKIKQRNENKRIDCGQTKA